MNRLCIGLLGLALVWSCSILLGPSLLAASVAMAADEQFKTKPFDPEPYQTVARELQRAVDLCIKEVREEIPFSRFDAYVEGDIVKNFGTEEDRFKFGKCMSRHGHPLGPTIRDKELR